MAIYVGVLLLGLPAVCSAGAGDGEVDEGWDLLATTSPREIARTCARAPKLPPHVRGSYYVSGPAGFESGSYAFGALFDGFGKINRFDFGNGEICYTASFLNTSYRRANEELAAKGLPPRGVLFEDTTPPRGGCPALHPMCDLRAPIDNNWVNTIPLAGDAVLISDTTMMLHLDTDATQVTGVQTWADDAENPMTGLMQPSWVHGLHMATGSSAHPLQRPGSTEYVEFILEMPLASGVEHYYLSLYTFDGGLGGEQGRERFATVRVDRPYYMHSFGVTENYVICPFNLVMDMPMPPQPTLLVKSFSRAWQGIHVIDRKGAVQVFQTEPFSHVHIANSFENASGIVMDLGVYSTNPFSKTPQLDIRMFKNKTLRDVNPKQAEVIRLHMHTSGPLQGKTTRESLVSGGRSIDFFKINPAFNGRPYCVYYATEWFHDDKSYASMAILKHDICKGTRRYWSRASTYLGEPFFVAQGPPGAEDGGVVVVLALDGRSQKSFLAVLDARTLQELERMDLPIHVPFTAHGQFIPTADAPAHRISTIHV